VNGVGVAHTTSLRSDLMLENVALLVAIPILVGVGIYFIVHPRRISDAWWYGSMHEPVNLYVIPPVCFLFSFAMLARLLESFDREVPVVLTLIVFPPSMFVLILGIFAFLGMPMPRFLMPKWIRERKAQERAGRRPRRPRKNSEKR